MDNLSINIVLDNKPLKSGLYSLYLQLIKDRKVKRVSLGIKTKINNFKNGKLTRAHQNYKQDNEFIIKIESDAHKYHRQLRIENPNYSLDELINKIKGKSTLSQIALVQLIDSITKSLEIEGRMSYAKVYKDTSNALKSFYEENKIQDINVSKIDKEFLEGFEVFMRNKGNQDTSIAIKMRQIRVAIYKAIDKGYLKESKNPFKKYKISKLKMESRKTALNLEQLKKFVNVDLTEHKSLVEAHDYFMFSFYMRGMNFFDILKLKHSDIQNGRLNYIRSKTKGNFSIGLNKEAIAIINKYKNEETEYVFPILKKPSMTPKQVKNRRHKVLSRVNRKLKEIAVLANIDVNLTFYVARHTYATNLKYLDVSSDKISELMGHKDVKVTMGYLKSFEKEELDKHSEELFKIL